MGRMDAINREISSAGKRAGKQFMDFDRLEQDWGVKLYKPADGDNFIRIIPPLDDNKYFGQKVFVHYSIGPNNSSYLCLSQMSNKPCPICQERDRIQKLGAEQEELRALNAWPARYVYLVVDTTSAEKIREGVKVFVAPNQINEAILSLSKDPRTGRVIDISDSKDGHDIYFKRTGKDLQTRYSGYRLEELSDVPEKVLAQIDDMPDLEDFLLFPTYEELKEAMEGGVGRKDEEEAPARRGRTEETEAPARRRSEPEEEERPRRRGEEQDSAEDIGRRVRERLAQQEEPEAAPVATEEEDEDRPRRRRR